MAATTSMIPWMSTYSVSDGTGSTFTTAQFNFLAAKALVRLNSDIPPGLPSDLFDEMHCLLILHLYEVARGKSVMTSERLGDYGYGKPTGASGFIQEYQSLLEQQRDALNSVNIVQVIRSDASIPAIEIDQANIVDPSNDVDNQAEVNTEQNSQFGSLGSPP